MRIDNTRLPVIIKSNMNMEAADNLSLSTEDKSVKRTGYSDVQSRVIQQTTVEKGLKTLQEELEKIAPDAQNSEILRLKEKISVLSNTLSNKDCEGLSEQGWSLNDTDVEAIVTVIDKIKMELLKAGVDISAFGDSISSAQIDASGAGTSEAHQIEQALKKADLPYTQENKDDFEKSLEQAESLKPCDEGSIKYMLDNELPPTVSNLYKAQHSGSGSKEETPQQELDPNLKKQVEEVILAAGLTVNAATLSYGSFLIENDIPVTPENIKYMDALSSLELPVDPNELMDKMALAVSEGNRPQDAVLIEEYSLQHRAADAKEVADQADDRQLTYLLKRNMPLTLENLKNVNESVLKKDETGQEYEGQQESGIALITARRQLEEIRLSMTIEANYKLLKQGITIETQPMEDLIAQLKGVEDDYYQSLLSNNEIEPTEENVSLLKESLDKTETLKHVPAYVLGGDGDDTRTINTLHESGTNLKSTMERAGLAYETLMTTPRSDMGDSIQKAFQNVDDILEDLELEATPANQRAVRILAYNNLEITQDSIAEMKAADQKVQLLFDNLSPSVVMELMKKGVNPLNMDVSELNQMAEDIRKDLNIGEEDKFSKYLWKLEQKNEITQEERDTFIGMYRMLHQVEQTDGAVIGALVHQGTDLTVGNLLTAVRNKKAAGMDVSLDENTSLPTGYHRSELTISEQIEAAYQSDCAKEAYHLITPDKAQHVAAENGWEEMTPEQLLWQMREGQDSTPQEEQYLNQQMEEFAAAKDVETSVLRLLNEYDMPVTTYNILAGNKMMNKRSQVFNQLFDSESLSEEVNFAEIKQQILEEFAEAVKTPEDMARAQEALADTAENVMKKMMETETVSSLDIRNMRILRQEIAISSKMAKEENYAIPVTIYGETTNVQLKIVRGTKEKGKVDILFETGNLGKVSAQIKVEETKVSGLVASDQQNTLQALKDQESVFSGLLELGDGFKIEMSYVHSQSLDLAHISANAESSETDVDEQSDAYQVQTKTLYGISKSFLTMLKGLE